MPKGLTMELDCVKDGRVYFKIKVTKYYLFTVIMKIASQNIRNPVTALLIVAFAFYYLVK